MVNRPDLFEMFGAVEAFDVDPRNAKIALTTVQGVFEPPLKDGADNPARHIRLGLGFFAPNVTPDFAAFILIHELAHFTSRRDGKVIDDHGRGWFNDTFIRPLSAAKQLDKRAPPCMTGKEHCESRQGLRRRHGSAPVATGSPQPPRIPNRE